MRRALVVILFVSAPLYGVPTDARLRVPKGLTFLRYCASVFGEAPYAVPLEDPRLAPLLAYYRHVDAADLESILPLFSTDSVYDRNLAQHVGIDSIREFFVERLDRLSGKHKLRSASIKGNQFFFFGTFKGKNHGTPVRADFLDYWVLDRDGKVYYRQSWISEGI
ncbi:MAG: nuclear transport factor 2 family protein [Bdellovibrionales bacterium]|nr:nuclear transport factor 2 family protein [Bdellovibrionales bacterium]